MIPELQLGIFAVATSTCDVHGDGDAITFPAANLLVPVVQATLEAAESQNISGGGWLPMSPTAFIGLYASCDINVTFESAALIVRNWDGAYPMKLEYTEDRESSIGKNVTFRMHMLGPYLEEPGCFTFSESGENACPTSCMMRVSVRISFGISCSSFRRVILSILFALLIRQSCRCRWDART